MQVVTKTGTFLILLSFLFSACSTYIPPGPKADMQVFAPADIQAGFDIKASNPFPGSLAVVRVQAPKYTNYYLKHHGGIHGEGRYTVILAKEAGEDLQMDRLAALPEIQGVTSINRMLLPQRLESDQEIRAAAARLQTDLLLIYTFDTAFFHENLSTPLAVISLGLSPTSTVNAITTCSALLMDTRTGYIYSAYEVTERDAITSTSWGSFQSADRARRNTEQDAFIQLTDEVIETWPQVLERHKP